MRYLPFKYNLTVISNEMLVLNGSFVDGIGYCHGM